MEACAPSKVILFGEHAVVYDKLGISAAVSLYSKSFVKRFEGNSIRIVDKRLNLEEEWDKPELFKLKSEIEGLIENERYADLKNISKKDIFAPIKYLLGTFIESYGFEPLKIEIESEIPMASGLGSGSSLFASVILSVLDFYQKKFEREEISKMTYDADVIAHGGTPSGIDNNTVVYGGYISFRKSLGIEPLKISKKIPMIIGNTNIPSNTSEMVLRVRRFLEKFPEKFSLLDEIDEISHLALRAIERENHERIGELMNENHKILEQLEVSCPMIEKLCKAARDAGALGAKLTGAGGGGNMIAIGYEKKEISSAISKAGGKAYVTEMGVSGVSLVKE